MKKSCHWISVIILAALLLGAAGCAAPQPAGLSDQQLAGTTENILKAIDANDYEAFTHDFSDKMAATFTQSQLTNLHDLLQNASGNFVSLGAPSLTDNQGYAVYRIPCKYEKETVFVTITFLIGGQKVEGLYFDSVNLRKASK